MTELNETQIIWFPLEYHGRQSDEYTQPVTEAPIEMIIELVQKRAAEDGEWAIANGFVGKDNQNEPKMRRMMEWVSRETNIKQCVSWILENEPEAGRSVDYVCRELANGSMFAANRSDSKPE